MSYYVDTFIEAAWTASIIPFSNDTTFTAMRLFGGFDMDTAASLSVMGATLGQMFNWFVGYYAYKYRELANFKFSEKWYEKIATVFRKYLVFLLLISWAPVGNVLLLIAGFTKTPLKLVMPLVFIGYCIYYFGEIMY